MTYQKLTATIGDSAELTISMEWNGAAFDPADEWVLIFTAKNSADDADVDAVFQKTSGAGIEVSGSVATISLVPDDSLELTSGARVFDIQAQRISDSKVRTVAVGEIYLMRDITRETSTSVPVVTTETPLPFALETTASILAKIGDGETIGAEYLPDALTIATGDPNIPQSMTVTGTLTDGTDPVVFPVLLYVEAGLWTSTGAAPGSGEVYFISNNAGDSNYELVKLADGESVATWVAVQAVATPDLVTTWTLIPPATGTPTVTAGPIFQGSHIGQLLRVLDTGLWYRWTGTAWALDASAEVTGTLPVANGGTGQTTAVAAFDALAPTTTKGDLIVHNGTGNVRLPIGTNGQVLEADSAEALGVKWATPSGGGSSVTISTTAPATPSAGDLWWNPDDGALSIYYDDGTSAQWVQTN